MFTPAPMLGGLSYSEAIALVTNKAIYVKGDDYGGSNGTTVQTSNWTNNGSVGGVFTANTSNAVWETNSQNGMPGVKVSALNVWLARSVTYDYNNSSIHGTNGAMTVFAVEKPNGSQGTQTGSATYLNAGIFGDVGQWSGHYYITRAVAYYNNTPGNQSSALSFSDNVPFVLGIRINTSGHYRVNFNGTSTYSDSTARTAPHSNAGNLMLCKSYNTNSNYGYEYITTADVLSDATIDKVVLALKRKWGIT